MAERGKEILVLSLVTPLHVLLALREEGGEEKGACEVGIACLPLATVD